VKVQACRRDHENGRFKWKKNKLALVLHTVLERVGTYFFAIIQYKYGWSSWNTGFGRMKIGCLEVLNHWNWGSGSLFFPLLFQSDFFGCIKKIQNMNSVHGFVAARGQRAGMLKTFWVIYAFNSFEFLNNLQGFSVSFRFPNFPFRSFRFTSLLSFFRFVSECFLFRSVSFQKK
jgi:hypothetical protein